MKKVNIIFLVLFVCCALAPSAQITKKQADEMVLEHLSQESLPYSLFAKEDVQNNMIIETAVGEILELDYACWVYYINYADTDSSYYLVVKETNGNLLAVNPKSKSIPEDLVEWRILLGKILFREYSLDGTSCLWTNFDYDYTVFNSGKILIINSNEKLENYINCTSGNYPEINFDNYSLIIAWGVANNGIRNVEKQLSQMSSNQYSLIVTIELKPIEVMTKWMAAIFVDKLSDNTNITLSTNIIY